MENKIIAKPNILQLISASLMSVLKDKLITKQFGLLDAIENYKLLIPVVKDKPYKKEKNIGVHNKFAIGIYRKGNKKYFIKTWYGTIKDIDYYDLVNEYRTNTILYEKINDLSKGSKHNVIIPRAIEYIRAKKSFSVVFEYIEGKLLAYEPLKVQIAVIQQIFSLLDDLSKALNEKEKNQLIEKNNLFYILSLPYLTALSIIAHPDQAKTILKMVYQCIKYVKKLNTAELVLAHRDLIPDNIFITKNNIVLLDNEKVTLTVPGYDLSYMATMAGLQNLYTPLVKKTKYGGTEFLENYITIQYGRIPINKRIAVPKSIYVKI